MENVVTRFPSGITNAAETSIFADMATMDPTKFHSQFMDFDVYLASDWVITLVGTGAVTQPDGDGGVILITNSAADDDSVSLQYAGGSGAVKETWLMEVGKRAFFKTRLKVSDAIESQFVMGLQIADTTPFVVSDGIYFLKADNTAALSFTTRPSVAAANTVSGIATLTNDTFVTLAWYYNGIDKVFYAVNDIVLGSLSTATALPDAPLAISFAIENGEAVAKSMTVDYVFVSKER